MKSITPTTIVKKYRDLGHKGKLSEDFVANIIMRIEDDVERYLQDPDSLYEPTAVCKKCGKRLTTEDVCHFCVDGQKWKGFSDGYNAGVVLKLSQLCDSKEVVVQILQRVLQGIKPKENLEQFHDRVLREIEEKRVLSDRLDSKKSRDTILRELNKSLAELVV